MLRGAQSSNRIEYYKLKHIKGAIAPLLPSFKGTEFLAWADLKKKRMEQDKPSQPVEPPMTMTPSPYSPYQEEERIDFKEWANAVWRGRWLVIATCIVFAVIGVMVALSQPNYYKANVVVAPQNKEGGAGLAGMASQFGGIASLAGINLGGSGASDEKTLALATLQSRVFARYFIEKHQALVPLMASEKWDRDTDTLLIDPELYDETSQQWVRKVDPGMSIIPTDWEAYKYYQDLVQYSEDKSTGLITITITHLSPKLVKEWGQAIVDDLNEWMRLKAKSEAEHNIAFLNQELENTPLAEMQTVFYQLIEEQTKKLMLANAEKEYLFKTIDPAVVPEEKAGPSRPLICILAVFIGGILSTLFLLARFALKR